MGEPTNKRVRRNDLVEPELSYQIVGALIDVQHDLGPGRREFVYQRAVAEALSERNLSFEEQVSAPLTFHGKVIGRVRFDFLVEESVVVEIKRTEEFSPTDIKQLFDYLKASGLRLGILAHFTKSGVRYKRVVNLR